MRWLILYLRSRRVPAAAAATLGAVALMWSLWSAFSNARRADAPMVILTVLLAVAPTIATVAGPDDALERTGARRWPPRRAAHLLTAATVALLLVLATLPTGARFGPPGLVARDVAGLLGVIALGTAVLGAARAWFAPLLWTLSSVVISPPRSGWGQALTWPAQPPDNVPAALTATGLAAAGLVAYAVAGPALRAPAEAPL
jgi:hypothetical protein